ncbi:hypothetical protein RBWH47_04875 [Rhodopirellula baltica WH47]|uniref:Uncharacterized protein n=1 Tax=Rhodopirellula baltica WH47 TaxID=991778 RepID=F2AY07_RHOBT|nr:hypothetical protein RBWH47_04875 [Rhodopirellula baltica WH47]
MCIFGHRWSALETNPMKSIRRAAMEGIPIECELQPQMSFN